MQVGKSRLLPPVSLGLRKVCGLLAQESLEKPQGESELSPWGFSRLSPDALHPGWRLLSAGSIVASPHSGHCSFRLISPPMKFPPQAVIGGSSGPEAITAPCRVSFQATAGVCFLVLSRYFRLCGSRGIIPLVRSGLKAQRNPFVRLSIATFTLHTAAVKILERE